MRLKRERGGRIRTGGNKKHMTGGLWDAKVMPS